MNEIKVIDNIDMLDKHFKGTIISGHLEIEDKFGNIVLEKDNLVVLQGRGFILRKLFAHPNFDIFSTAKGNIKLIGSATAIEVDSTYVPLLFTMGNNGVTGNSVQMPLYSDSSITSVLNKAGKAYSDIEYVQDTENNECYAKLSLVVSSADFPGGGGSISEAGLLFGPAVYNAATNSLEPKGATALMTRVTFDKITISNGDEFTIRYFLYA